MTEELFVMSSEGAKKATRICHTSHDEWVETHVKEEVSGELHLVVRRDDLE